MPVSDEDIIAAFEVTLGRPPLNERDIAYHRDLSFPDRVALGEYLCCTDEFGRRYARLVAEGKAPRPSFQERAPSIFLGDRVLTETHRGHKLYLYPTDVDLTPCILFHGSWEGHVEAVLTSLLRPGQQVVDIGANIGYHTIGMGATVGTTGVIHAFEASPVLARLLRASVFVNHLGSVIRVHNLAAMDRTGTITLASTEDHLGSGNVVPANVDSVYEAGYPLRTEVPCRPLDDVLPETSPPVDLIHMDIEGAEPMALRGAARLLARSPGVRIVSEWSLRMMSAHSDVNACVDWLHAMSFRFWLVTTSGGLEPIDRATLMSLPHSDVVIARDLGG